MSKIEPGTPAAMNSTLRSVACALLMLGLALLAAWAVFVLIFMITLTTSDFG
jgi:hypothetical protein